MLYSDGITEAVDARGEMFGEERLEGIFLKNKESPPADIKASILQALSKHCGEVAQDDDITLVVAKAV